MKIRDINQLVIFNGGYGTRVKKKSKSKPKCLIKFKNYPFIYWQIQKYVKQGIKEIIFCLGYKNREIINELNSYKFKNLKIRIVVEKKKLGTGGALKNCKKYLNNVFFVTYGDSWLNIDIQKIKQKYYLNKKNIISIISKKYVNLHKPNVLIANKKILKYKKNSKNFNYLDFGFFVFNKEYLRFLKIKKKKFDLENYLSVFIQKGVLDYYIVKNKFYEIGSVAGIKEFKNKVENEIFYETYLRTYKNCKKIKS